jgi:hypothetical protein
MTMRNDRRRILGLLAATGGAALVSLPARSRVPLAAALVGVLSHREGARAIGAAYLQQVPWESNARQLMSLIVEHDPSSLGEQASLDEARAFLQRSVREDFEQSRTVELNGWVVSRTEARLCALSCLV